MLQKVADKMVSELENFSQGVNSMDSYTFEKGITKILRGINYFFAELRLTEPSNLIKPII